MPWQAEFARLHFPALIRACSAAAEGSDVESCIRTLVRISFHASYARFLRARPASGLALCLQLLALLMPRIERVRRVSDLPVLELDPTEPVPYFLRSTSGLSLIQHVVDTFAGCNQILQVIAHTMIGLKGELRPSEDVLAPLESLLGRLSNFTASSAFVRLPFGHQSRLMLANMWLLNIIGHSGVVILSPETVSTQIIRKALCEAPWIQCQANLAGHALSPCGVTSVFNEQSLAHSGLSMCAKVRSQVRSRSLPCSRCA